MKKTKTETIDVPVESEEDEEEDATAEDDSTEEDSADDDEDEDEEEPKQRTEKKTVEKIEWEKVNNNVAIWARSPKDVTDEEYNKFFKSITKDYTDPQSWIHFRAEGELEFRSIVFIPGDAAHDLYDNYYSK